MNPQQNPYASWLMAMAQQQQMPYYPPMGPFGQVQTPTVQPPAQPQQPQNTNPSYVYGRIVESDADIKPSEVPMDGTLTLFPKSDFSCIYAKRWTKDGLLKPMNFVLEQREEAAQVNTVNTGEQLVVETPNQDIGKLIEDKLKDYLSPINDTQVKILEALQKGKSKLIVKEE